MRSCARCGGFCRDGRNGRGRRLDPSHNSSIVRSIWLFERSAIIIETCDTPYVGTTHHASTPGSAVVVVDERNPRTVPLGKATSQAVGAAEAQR
jgi:hypothetical protein